MNKTFFKKLFAEKKSKKSRKIVADMIKGYRKMAKINIELANEGIVCDNEALKNYEVFLSECEDSDSKTRRHFLRGS